MNLTTLTTQLRKRIGNPSTGDVPDADLHQHINDAYRDIADRFRFHQARTRYDLDTVASTATYALPATMLSVLRVWDETNKVVLERIDDQAFGAVDDTIEGKPIKYIRFNDSIILVPTPDDVYQLYIFGTVAVDDLSSGSDSPVLPTPWHHGIVLLARFKYYDTQGDIPKAQYSDAIYQAWLKDKPVEVDQESVDIQWGVRVPQLAAGVNARPGNFDTEE